MLPADAVYRGNSSSSASPSPVATPQGSKEASLSGRKVVHLPAEAQHRSKLEKIGIQWMEPVDKNPFLAKALLPEGWEAIDTPLPYHHFFTLYDEKQMPRVDVFVKSDTERKTRVTVFTQEESERRIKTDREKKKSEEDKAAKLLVMVKEVRSKRSEEWSEKCPYGVFFILDLNDHGMSATIKAQKRSCHGFFQTEEIANQAMEILKEQAGLFDRLFVQKLNNSNLNLDQKGSFVIVDGFTNSAWWQTGFGGFVFN